ncbi:hypothetical protein D1007_04746 [Hordeum vulgare]|nr:hypothetical protein D1007_04746 [Hordeum vulgare]
MDGGNFDAWGTQPSASGPAAQADLNLNSQASASEGFPGLGLYGAFLQSDSDELLPGRGRSSGLPPCRRPRAGAGDGLANPTPPFVRQLDFGGSSSAADGRGGGNDSLFVGGSSTRAGGGVRQRANSAAAAPGRRNQRNNTAIRDGGGGQRVPPPRVPRSAVRGQASGYGAPFDNDDEELEDDVEELSSFRGPPVSQREKKRLWHNGLDFFSL